MVYKMEADVKATTYNGERCINDVDVTWGVYYDTISIVFLEYSLMYYTASKEIKHVKKNEYRELLAYVKREIASTRRTAIYLLQDCCNEFYIIRIIQDLIKDGSYTILVTNVEYGIPSYTLHFGNRFCLCN
jgi:hypothetical protein